MADRILLCAAALLVTSTSWAQDFDSQRMDNWHQWRGPLATGVAPEGNPPATWNEQTNIKWKVAIPGRGHASPIVWGDRIFVLTAIKTDRQVESTESSANVDSASRFRLTAFQPPAPQPDEPAEEASNEERPRPERRRGRRGGRFRGFGGAPPTHFHQFVVLCLDRNTGETIWQEVAADVVPHEGHHQTGSYASASPVTDGRHVYASFGSRGIYCYDMAGNQRWQQDLGQMQIRFRFGEGASPALYGDTLVLNWDHEGQSFLAALDARTGDIRWKVDRDESTSWSTPLIVENGGRAQVVVNGAKRARGYDLKTGEVLWECGGQAPSPIPTPVTMDGMVYCMTGFRGFALYAIPLDARGDITDSDQIAWKLDRGTPYVCSPILYNGLLYFTKERQPILSCVDARTGEVLINQERLPDLDDIYASPVGAAGRIYITARNGKTAVVRQGKELEVIGTNQLDDTIDASPAIVGNQMFIRSESHLYCIAQD